MKRKFIFLTLLKVIAMNQAELLEKFNQANAKIDKIASETEGLIAAADALQAALDKAGVVSPEVVAAMDVLIAKLNGVDDKVLDPVVAG